MIYNLRVHYTITVWFLIVHYVNGAGLLWDDVTTESTTPKMKHQTTTQLPIPITEKQGPFSVRDDRSSRRSVNPKLICTQRDGVIKCYYVNEGIHVQRFNGKVLFWSLLTLTCVRLISSSYW
ncbi:unnamed protein product [Schistosoma turkestanicum]|nr:unnamed protein product [Schistosoma turkestanicum]